MDEQKRTRRAVVTGWILTGLLYFIQIGVLAYFVGKYHDKAAFAGPLVLYLLVFIPLGLFIKRNKELGYADEDKKIWLVWIILGSYIVAFAVTVAMVFCKVTPKLTKGDALGINGLKATLCITPILLILLLHLAICPSYRKAVLSLSILAALNIFDGIEMLEIILMKYEGHLELDDVTEGFIIAFSCLCFVLSSVGLCRNKFNGDGEVKERGKTSTFLGPMEIIGTNLPFLVLRAVVWGLYGYEASVFIAKNIVSLVVGFVEFLILKKWLIWGEQ